MNKPKFTRNDIQASLISSGIEPEQARTLTTRIIETMVTALVTGKVIELRGLGTLEPRTRKARTRHNPRTMAPVDVPARCVIFFRSGEKLKKALNGGQGKPCPDSD